MELNNLSIHINISEVEREALFYFNANVLKTFKKRPVPALDILYGL